MSTIDRYVSYGFTQKALCLLIGISRAFYYKIKIQVETGFKKSPEKSDRIGLNVNAILPEEKEAIIIYAKANPNYNHRELTWRMIDNKVTYVGMTTVYRILRENGLICANKMRKNYGWEHKYSNEANSPDERWQTDITYLKYCKQDVYQLSFIDVYSRYVVISETLLNMESKTVRDVFKKYIEENKNDLKQIPIIQSDNGSPYIGYEFKNALKVFEVEHVFCTPATPTENIIIERWHRTFKEHLYDLENPEDFEKFKEDIKSTVEYYNNDRYHQSLGYMTPYEYYRGDPKKIQEERKNYRQIVRSRRKFKNIEMRKTLSI